MGSTPQPPAPSGPQPTPIHTAPRAIGFETQNVPPPSPLYVQQEDHLVVLTNAPTVSVGNLLTLLVRMLLPNGEISRQKVTFPIQGSLVAYDEPLPEGTLLSVTVTGVGSVQTDTGGTFVTIAIRRNITDLNVYDWILCADYCANTHFPSWPPGRNIDMRDGAGRLRSITGSTPAAGAEISEVVPAGVRWRLIAFRFFLTASAAVATRQPALTLDDGANVYDYLGSLGQITASSATFWNYSDSSPMFAPTFSSFPGALPSNVFLQTGHRIRTLTQSLQAGDQYNAPQYLVQEWISA